MKLTEKQIGHIEAALQNMGMVYRDIRQEMTDHVASAIEEMEGYDFYAGFRQYMLLHKKELKATYYRFVRAAKIKALKLMFKTLFTLQTGAVVAVAYCTMLLLQNYYDINESAFILKQINAVLLAAPMLYYLITTIVTRNKRFSGLDKLLGSLTGFAVLFVIPLQNEGIWSNEIIFELYNAVGCGFSVALLATFVQLTKKYRLQYK